MPNTKRLLRILRKRMGPKQRSAGKRRFTGGEKETLEETKARMLAENPAMKWSESHTSWYKGHPQTKMSAEARAKMNARRDANAIQKKKEYDAFQAAEARRKEQGIYTEQERLALKRIKNREDYYSKDNAFGRAVRPFNEALVSGARAIGQYGKQIGLPKWVTAPATLGVDMIDEKGLASSVAHAVGVPEALRGKGLRRKWRRGFGLPSDEMYKMAAKNAYDAQAGPMPGGYRPIFSSATLKIWHNPQDGDIFVGVRGTYDTTDMKANASLPFNNLESTVRYKKDEADLLRVMRRYPSSQVHFASHSLGAAIARRLENKVRTASSRAFNPAFEPSFVNNRGKQQRIYRGNDFLGQLGRYLPGAQHLPPAKTDQTADKTKWYDPRTWQAFQHHSMSGFGQRRRVGGMDPQPPRTPEKPIEAPSNPSPAAPSPEAPPQLPHLTGQPRETIDGHNDAVKFTQAVLTGDYESNPEDFYQPPSDPEAKKEYLVGWHILEQWIPANWGYAADNNVPYKIRTFLRSKLPLDGSGKRRRGGASSASSSDSESDAEMYDIDDMEPDLEEPNFEPYYSDPPKRLKRSAKRRKVQSSFANPIVERATKTAQKQLAAAAMQPPADRNYSVVSLVL